jgi:hypothetical protein
LRVLYSGNSRYRAFLHHANFDDLSENCLSINVFTPGINDGKKRPVLLWMHGGAWHYGISHEHDGVIGENLARGGDIVFCSINHRLGPMGFPIFLMQVGRNMQIQVMLVPLILWQHWSGFAITYQTLEVMRPMLLSWASLAAEGR